MGQTAPTPAPTPSLTQGQHIKLDRAISPEDRQILDNSEQLEIYQLGNRVDRDKSKPAFHDIEIASKVAITDPPTKAKLLASVYDAIVKASG